MRHHLGYLGVQALAHFAAAVVHQHRAIGVDMHQRTRLVEVVDVEGDAELHRGQRQALLEHRALSIEGRDLSAALCIAGLLHQFRRQGRHDVVHHRLTIGRGVALGVAIPIGLAHGQRVYLQMACDVVDDDFGDQRALRPAKATEGRVALRVGAGQGAQQRDLGQPVGVVDVAQRARHHGR